MKDIDGTPIDNDRAVVIVEEEIGEVLQAKAKRERFGDVVPPERSTNGKAYDNRTDFLTEMGQLQAALNMFECTLPTDDLEVFKGAFYDKLEKHRE